MNCLKAADEIERLAALAQSDAEPVAINDAREQALSEAYVKGFEDGRAQSDADQGWTIAARAATERDELKLRVAELERALAQSNAEPVAWRYRLRITKDDPWSNWILMPSADGLEVCAKYPENYETQSLGIITASPRPDASAELIDAAENVVIAFGMGWDMEGVIERLTETLPQDSVCRARVADRSEK